jgi:hypothetical protein
VAKHGWGVGAFFCGLTRHDDFVAHEPGRLFLRCSRCGRETSGWRIGAEPARTERRLLVSISQVVSRLVALPRILKF